MLSRFVRAVVDAWRSDEAFRVLLALVVSLLVSGTTFLSLVENWSVVDAFYFSVTPLTTVGFGDPAPTTTLGKLFTVVYTPRDTTGRAPIMLTRTPYSVGPYGPAAYPRAIGPSPRFAVSPRPSSP